MSREQEFLKKFKKLSALNEAVITKVDDSDDVLPHQHLGLAEEDANKDQAANVSGNTPTTGATTSGTTPTVSSVTAASAVANNSPTSPEAEFDQNIPTQPNNSTDNPIVSDTKENEEDIQNELLKLQVSAMKKMSDKISELESTIGQISMNMTHLANDVNKVKDPSPMEKLENRWQDSYPFKYTLNDLWDGNAFQGRKDLFNNTKDDSIIKKSSDGSYEANFEEMPKVSDFELKKSFEVY